MATIKKQIVINATPEEVNAITLDPATWPRWFDGVQEISADDTFPQVGGVVKLKYRSIGTTFELSMTSTSFQRGDHLNMKMEGMITGTQNWQYQSQNGSTLVTCVFDYELPGGGLGAIADKLLFERTNNASTEKSLKQLKSLVEG